jgi:hypothetical protein
MYWVHIEEKRWLVQFIVQRGVALVVCYHVQNSPFLTPFTDSTHMPALCNWCYRMCGDCRVPGTLCLWTDCAACCEGCAGSVGECTSCLGGAGEAAPVILIMALVALALFAVIGIFYSVLVATMVGQRIWQRHYHILAKRMLTKVSLPRHLCSVTWMFDFGVLQAAQSLEYG